MQLKWLIEAGKFLTDPALKIPESHLIKVCKRSSGPNTCRYIGRTPEFGFVCVKNTPLKESVDLEVKTNPMWNGKGDNCDGFVTYGKKESIEGENTTPNKDQESNTSSS